MDSALNKDKSELAILVLSVSLQMLPHVDCLLDQMVEILWNFWGKAVLFEDSENLIASDTFDLGDSVVVSQYNTDLRGRASLFSQFNDLFDQVIGGNLYPAGRSSSVGKTSARNTLAV